MFVPIGDRAVRYATSGEAMGDERFRRLKAKRLVKILIREEDEGRYREFLGNVLKRAEDEKRPIDERASAMGSASDAAGEELVQKVEDASVYKKATDQFARFAEFLRSNPQALPLVLKSCRDSPERDHVSHGSLVGTLALALAEKMDLLKVPGSRAQLMAAAFLHDTALEKANLPFRAEGAYAPEQEQLWRAHPVKAAEVLAGLPHVDRLTFEIIAQHEECPNGSGFPKGLAQNALNPLSAVVALANRFDHTLVENPGQALPELLKEFKVKHLGIFDLPQLTDLEKTILASF